MKAVLYSSERKKNWDEFNENSKSPVFMFNRDYMEYHKDRFRDNSLMFFNEKDELSALFPASVKDGVLTSHGGLTYGGFVTDSTMKQHSMNELFDCLLEFSRKNGISKIVYKKVPHIFHLQPAEEDVYALFLNDARIFKIEAATVLNFANPIKLPKGRKAQISRAKRESVEISESTDFDAFIELENSVLEKYHGARAVHTGKELALLHSFFPQNIRLFGAFHGGKMIAGTVIYEYKNVVHTQYLAADDEARKIGALDFVVWSVIEKYRTAKKYLDFGISTENNGKFLNEGLIWQKEGFGGRTIAYTTWEIDV